MRQRQYHPHPAHVQAHASVRMQKHLHLKDHGRKCRADTLCVTVLLYAASRITSLSDACQRLRDAPSDETARKALLATLPDYAELQRQLNAALAGHLPKALRNHLQRLAIDLTLIPYHGQPFRDLDEIYRGQAKSGTSHFHAYATAYVVRKGRRFTVALTSVGRHDALPAVLQRLLRERGASRCPPALSAAGSRVLQRGRGPLTRRNAPLRLADAVGVAWPQGRAPRRGPSGSRVFPAASGAAGRSIR